MSAKDKIAKAGLFRAADKAIEYIKKDPDKNIPRFAAKVFSLFSGIFPGKTLDSMKKGAEDLEKSTHPSINIYVAKTGLTEEEIKEKMDREEWITSQEAYEWGFSTTQKRKDAMQSLETDFVYNLVMQNKAMQKTIKQQTEEIKKIKEETSNSNFTQNNSKPIKNDYWESFFNRKK